MNSFPLFVNLYNSTEDKDLTINQKNSFMKKIKTIDKNGLDLIYALILYYQIEKKNIEVPYTHENNNVIIDMELIPLQLKQIIYKFILMHLKTMTEEINRKEALKQQF